jgi:oligopeptide transport system substrate-binding protein
VYDGLVRLTSDGTIEKALAKQIDVSEDGKVYIFLLRDAKWTDGSPITAHDFEHSWKTTLTSSCAFPCPHLLYPIKNAEKAFKGAVPLDDVAIRALDERTLRVELEHPTPYFLSLIAFCNFYPVSKRMDRANPSWEISSGEMPFSGPFMIEKWERNKEVVLKKNPSYWNADNVLLDGIRLMIIPDGHTVVQMFENGELDFVTTGTASLSPENLKHCKDRDLLRVVPMGGLAMLAFNLDVPPFNNKKLRQAMVLSVDWKSLIGAISQLSEQAATRVIPPVLMNGENRNILPSYNPNSAKTLFEEGLTEAGLDRKEFVKAAHLLYQNAEQYRNIALGMQHGWKQNLGIDVSIYELESNVLYKRLANKEYAFGITIAIAQYNDANNIFERFKIKKSMKNYPGFENEEYVRLLDEAAQTNDEKKRFELIHRAEDVLISELPFYPIFHFNNGVLISEYFDRVEFSPLGNLLFKDVIPKEIWR